MKRIIFALLLLSQLAYAQYRTDIFSLDLTNDVSQWKIEETFSRDTTLVFIEHPLIFGLSISGTAVLDNDNDSYIRVTLVDEYNYEFLIYENYPALSDDLTTTFSNVALETVLLDDVTPQYLKISVRKASLRLESVNKSVSSGIKKHNTRNPSVIHKAQTQYIVDKLNANLESRNMTWRARVTSMSEKTFSEKKDMFGGSVPELYGFEHYAGGIFVMPGEYLNSNSRSLSSVEYVSEWDWRNRHGKWWMTNVKDQGNCNSCWAFSSIGAFESYINLYYNQLLNFNLSEQEIVSCGNAGDCQNGGNLYLALTHIQSSGAIPEDCFPYTATNDSCDNNQGNPSDVLSFDQYQYVYTTDENSLKEMLFRSPLCFGIRPWWHFVVLVGFKKIYSGEYYFTINNSSYTVPISSDNPLVEHPAWLIKNSRGTNWGDGGYGYVVMSLSKAYSIYKITGNVISQFLNESNIVCEDADGDGYYFWGVNDIKPSYCPAWVPDIKDGHDADYTKGKLLLENTPIIGELETLNPDDNPALVISGNLMFSTRQSRYSHVRISSGGKLTVKNILNLFGRVTVTIESGGELVIDGGVVTNADINMVSGGKITLINGGKLVMRTNTDFIVPTGAHADIQDGEILRSNDF